MEDGEETTTHEPFPFFDEAAGSVNVTTHLGNSVHLHCRVNDLNGKTVSDIPILLLLFSFFRSNFQITAYFCRGFFWQGFVAAIITFCIDGRAKYAIFLGFLLVVLMAVCGTKCNT